MSMIKRMNRSFVLAVVTLALSGSASFAQVANTPGGGGNRPALEQQFRQRVAKLAQQRLELTDGQMTQLQQSNARFAPQLNQIVAQERETRRQLRMELTSPTPNQQHVGVLLDQSLQLQRQRIDLVAEEQKDLARFMTPVQRARYVALQQQFRRRAQELSRQDPARQGFGGRGLRPGLKKIR